MSKRFTEGICGDGAAILDNGKQITITEILNNLNRLDELEQLRIGGVSQQRELLVDFWMKLPNTNKNKGLAKYYVDKYFESTNCG